MQTETIGSAILHHGDCFDVMPTLQPNSINMILADLPYGTTRCKWDSVLPLDALWREYERILVSNGVIALTASQPFTSSLVLSNPKWFRHEWIWKKNKGGNFLNTVREPMKEHEAVVIFSPGRWTYNKQMEERAASGASRAKYKFDKVPSTEVYNKISNPPGPYQDMRVPSSVQKFNVESGLHPTQKPVALMQYLIRTYTNPGDVVIDNCMGSGTTGVAALREGRRFIGIEREEKYFDIAADRLRQECDRLGNAVPNTSLLQTEE